MADKNWLTGGEITILLIWGLISHSLLTIVLAHLVAEFSMEKTKIGCFFGVSSRETWGDWVSHFVVWCFRCKTAPTSLKKTPFPTELKGLDQCECFGHTNLEKHVLNTNLKKHIFPKPMPSMYGIFNYIWLISMVHVGKYAIHGSYGKYCRDQLEKKND